jgi:Zn-dependent peptidase ImmA (M78 family)/DNA-binding XRE family transcriptional regulator
MAKGTEAIVKPDLLIWARESAGLTLQDVAAKIQKSQETVLSWERGTEVLSIPQLIKLADIYKRSLAVFFLPSPPEEHLPLLHDFRKLDSGLARAYTPELRLLLRDVERRREVALELAEQLGEFPLEFPMQGTQKDDPEHLANQLRNHLNVTYASQVRWRDHYEALKSWINAIESLGVLVFQSSKVPIDQMRGLSISYEALPVIVINAKDHPHARIFTLMHELAHILLRYSGLCNLEEHENDRSTDQATEVFCNHVAGAILVPQDNLSQESVLNFGLDDIDLDLDDAAITTLSRRYSVSREVIVRRLLLLGKVSPAFYRKKRSEYSQNYQQNQPPGGSVPQFRLILRDNGYAFTRLVVDAYRNESITASDLSDHLGVRLKHLPKLESELYDKL